MSKFSRKSSLTLAVSAWGAVAVIASGCGKSTDATADSMNISGTLATGTVSAFLAEPNEASYLDRNEVEAARNELVRSGIISATSVESYGVRCVTLSGTPQSGEGQCNTAGNFNLQLAAATNVPIGCFVISGAGSTAKIVAVVGFQGTSTSLSGGAQREGSYVAGGGTTGLQFGSVTLDLDKGQAVVTKSAVQAVGGTGGAALAGNFADMTGAWTIHAVTNLPAGYQTASASGGNGNGPTDGMSIYFGMYNATDGTNAHHGLSIWQSQASLAACGGEGITLPSGWSLTAGSSTNHYLTDPLTGLTTTFANPTATTIQSNGGQNHCNITTIDPSHNKCADIVSYYSTTGTWNSVSGGTTNTDHWGLSPAECEFYCSLNNSYNQSGCSGEINVNWGALWGSNGTMNHPFTGITWNGSAWTGLTADTTHTDYVGYFSNNVQFRKKPKSRFMANELVINGSVGTLLDHSDHMQQACATYNSTGGCTVTPVNCHVQENNRLTITQTSANEALVELVQQNGISPADDPLCTTDTQARIQRGETKTLFKITR